MKNELYKLSAVDLLSMYKTRETNPLEVSLDIIKQLEYKNSQFNAFVCFDKEKILQQAKLDNINVFQLLDTLKKQDTIQLSTVVTEVLNYNREKISTLGYKIDNTANRTESRNIEV